MRRHIKGVISLLLCAVILASAGVSAFAALEVSAAPEETGDGSSILDSDVISAKVNALIQQYKDAGMVKADTLAIAYTYLATGDSWNLNPDMWFYSASIYKVPLMMIMAEKEHNGEVDQTTDIKGLPLSQVEKVVLVDSNNDYAHATMSFITGQTEKKSYEKASRPLYQAYSSLPESYYHKDFVDYSYFTARFMNDVMITLYNEQNRFPNITGLLKQSMPERYFHLKLGDQYEIAQKYGYYKDSRGTEWHNNTGIIYTPNPIVITVMTADAKKGEQFMGDVAELFVNYTLELDSKLASYKVEQERLEQERIAAEKAAAEAEAKAKAEEEERIARAEADRKAAEEAALRAAEKEQKAAERKDSVSKILKYVGIAGAGVLVLLIAVGVLSSIRKRRALSEDEERFERKLKRDYDDDYDDDDDDYDEEDEEYEEAAAVKKRSSARSGSGISLGRKSAARTSRYEEDDEDDEDEDGEDEDEDEAEQPRRRKGFRIAAMRGQSYTADEYDGEDEDDNEADEDDEDAEEEEAPRPASRSTVKIRRAPTVVQKTPVYEEDGGADEEEEADPDDIDSTLAYMKTPTRRPTADDGEVSGGKGIGRGRGASSGGYRPRH